MLKYLIRKFDSWWLGQIDIGLVHITHAEYVLIKTEWENEILGWAMISGSEEPWLTEEQKQLLK